MTKVQHTKPDTDRVFALFTIALLPRNRSAALFLLPLLGTLQATAISENDLNPIDNGKLNSIRFMVSLVTPSTGY